MIKIDLVIQGTQNSYGEEIVRSYNQLPWINNIIISCWEGDEFNLEGSNIIIKKSKPIKNNGIGNRNAQITTSYNGLLFVSTKFCAKLRSDQKISLKSMNILYKKMISNPDRIGALGFYSKFPFHPRDHSFWGSKENLVDLFDIPHDSDVYDGFARDVWPQRGVYCNFRRAECYIASSYLAKKDERVKIMAGNPKEYLYDYAPKWPEAFQLDKEVMIKYFYPMPRIDIVWPKHGLTSYHYELCERELGEYWDE